VKTEPWYVEAFRVGYLDVYAHRDDSAAAGEVAFPAEAAALCAGARVLDAGCGAGRHSRALSARGLDVIGLDLSGELLTAAAGAAPGSPPDARASTPRYVQGDLRALPFTNASFDGVLSFFTSFGYFGDDGNLVHAKELRRVLRREGRLVLDFLHAPYVRATLVSHSQKRRGGHTIVEERALRDGRVEKDVTMTAPNGATRRWRESVRLYDPDELTALFTEAGFHVLSRHGDLSGGALGAASRRCVLVAEAA